MGKIENEQIKNKAFITYIDKDDKKKLLNKLNEELIELNKKISDIKNEIKDTKEENNKNNRRVKNYLGLKTEYKHLKKLIILITLIISVLFPVLSVGSFLGISKTLIAIVIMFGLTETVGLTTAKLVFENYKKKLKIKYFNDKDITFDEMKNKVKEKDDELNKKVNELEIKKAEFEIIKKSKKQEIERIKDINKDNDVKKEEDQIKYEDDSIKKESVKKKK